MLKQGLPPTPYKTTTKSLPHRNTKFFFGAGKVTTSDLMHLWTLGMFLTCVLALWWLINNEDKHK